MQHVSPARRRAFLKTMVAGTVAAAVPRHAAAAAQAASADPEDIVGSPRWPGDRFRASDFRNRFHDLGELLEISRRVPDDVKGYLSTWQQAREAVEGRAAKADKAGARVTAGDYYFQASGYATREYVLNLRMANVPRTQASYRTVRELFDRGIERRGDALPFERVSIPYGNATLPGIFVPAPGPPGGRRPVVYRTGGTDSCKEASYMTMAWSPFVDRGVSCFFMDGPGQGESLNERGIRLVPDYERAVTAAFDYLVTRPDVDPKGLGLYGQSTGGYFGGRGAAFEKRLAAVVLQGACYDLLEDCYEFCPSFRRHLRYMMGAADDGAARKQLAAYNLRGIAGNITAPISVMHGVRDDAVRFAGAERLVKEIGSKEKHFRPVDAVRGLGDSASAAVQELVDWMCVRLGAGRAGTA